MLGMRLLEMEAGDALDVIHVLLEEDSIQVSDEHRNEKHRVRDIIYGDLYGMTDRFVARPGSDDDASPSHYRQNAQQKRPTKPYIPPTPMEALPGILGAPIG